MLDRENPVKETPQLILASQSPRRRELLQAAGFDFEVRPPADSAECGLCSGESPPAMVARLSWQKARDVAEKVTDGIVVGCDTVAECHGQILGKPENREHAAEMLRLIRGRRHRVYSGLCLWYRPENAVRADVDVSQLRMEAISDRDLEDYLDSQQWIGKAGAFGFQDKLGWIHLERGSESNVVGLPLEMFHRLLQDLYTEIGCG